MTIRILQALPMGKRFDRQASTSVELCVSEWVSCSRYRATTTVVAEESDAEPMIHVAMLRLPPRRRLRSLQLALGLRRFIRRVGADLIVTQQHIGTAARVAALNSGTPVILQTHNFIEAPAVGRFAAFRNARRRRQLNRLAGITFISEATRARFEAEWPMIAVPHAIVTNGFDFSTWNADRPREKTILMVGRCQPDKGLLEAAEACARFLPDNPAWKATFIISEIEAARAYHDAIIAALAPVRGQCEVRVGVPYAEVRAITETAAIVIVASKWIEPFGRTALEAHAAGAALISSGSGGLRQISGEAAAYLDAVTADAIAAQIEWLARDEGLRTRLARAGAARVRALFPIGPAGGSNGSVCETLDAFYERVVGERRQAGS